MRCPICNNELVEDHRTSRHFSLTCKIPYTHTLLDTNGYEYYQERFKEHYGILYCYDHKTNEFHIDNEGFTYDNIVMQKVYFRRPLETGFFWSIRKDKDQIYTKHTLFHISLSEQEFIKKFGLFNPFNIEPIINHFEIFETFK